MPLKENLETPRNQSVKQQIISPILIRKNYKAGTLDNRSWDPDEKPDFYTTAYKWLIVFARLLIIVYFWREFHFIASFFYEKNRTVLLPDCARSDR